MPKDSTYLLYKYYTGRFAYANKNYDEAIRLFSDLVDGETENISSAEHIYQCYIDKGDSAKANEMLDIYIEKFPKEQWFMQNRINNLVSSGNTEAALVYLDKAIERAPQGQYYNSKASILSCAAFLSLRKSFTDGSANTVVANIKLGDSFDADAVLKSVLSNEKIFGVNLYDVNMAGLVCQYFTEMTAAPGAVLATLQKYV